jgi:hypothetical protein
VAHGKSNGPKGRKDTLFLLPLHQIRFVYRSRKRLKACNEVNAIKVHTWHDCFCYSVQVIVMDEATASVDMQTDAAIQDTIRQQFKHSTVLTIAHRLDTVLACNRVMVLGEGRVLEMGEPKTLMADPNSIFHGMTADSHAVAEMLG